MAKFAVGDTVRLTREVMLYPIGTIGVVARVDDDGWIMVAMDNSREKRCIMTLERWGDLEKIMEVNDGKS